MGWRGLFLKRSEFLDNKNFNTNTHHDRIKSNSEKNRNAPIAQIDKTAIAI